MKVKTHVASLNLSRQALIVSFLVVTVAVVIGLAVFNPIWSRLSPPFPILRASPPITAPVDGPYYLLNAENGYQWNTKEPLSLWYHPLLPFLISALPNWLPLNIWFWLLSLLFAVGSLVLMYQIATIYFGSPPATPVLLAFVLLIPGGLAIATGNPEIPTLFFSSLLLLSIIKWHDWRVTVLASAASVLTKPNALYMIPVLMVYAVAGYKEKNRQLLLNTVLGIVSITITWLAWIVFVDWQSNSWGAYWEARKMFAKYVAGDPSSYFLELARSFAYGSDLRDKIRYSTGLIIPLVNLWVIALTPLPRDTHRYALAAGNLAMLGLVLWQGNPNKVIVYTTTLPGYFAIFMIFLRSQLSNRSLINPFHWLMLYGIFWLYLALMLALYVIGTPLGWYY